MSETETFQRLAEANEALLPPLYARWATGLLNDQIPNESLATCHDCAMCKGCETTSGTEMKYFNPSVKCCTYTPALPNFLIGAILLDPDVDPIGRRSVVDRLERRVGVNPLAMEMPPDYNLRYGVMAAEAFGRVPGMRCPHYLDREGGLCGIWRHRNSVCSTWFCKYVRGQVGMEFWGSLRDLLYEVEKSLSFWAASEVGIHAKALRFEVADFQGEETELSSHDLSGTVDRESYDEIWGSWSGREAEFFQGCAQAVKALEWPEVERIGGAALHARARIVLEDFAKLKERKIPTALRLGQFEILEATSEGLRINGYSAADPLEMSPVLLKIFPYFDGSRTEEILARIAENERIEIDTDLLIRLIDSGLVKESTPDKRVD